MCGSSFINERFEDLLITKLKTEDYLEQNGETLSRIINGLVVDFERQGKKKMDLMFRDRIMTFTVNIPGLRANKKKRFQNGKMCLTR
jgi:transcription initiation factor TFIID subunit TAF12